MVNWTTRTLRDLRTHSLGQKLIQIAFLIRDASEAQLGVSLWRSTGSGWTHPLSASCLMLSNTRQGHMDPQYVPARRSPDSGPAETLSERGMLRRRTPGPVLNAKPWDGICIQINTNTTRVYSETHCTEGDKHHTVFTDSIYVSHAQFGTGCILFPSSPRGTYHKMTS